MGKTKVTIHRSAYDHLLRDMVKTTIQRRTKAVEEACNEQSSWGGYASAVSDDGDRVRGRIWSYARQDGKGKTERAQRMIRNLDAQ